jgi:hypothetical protein
MVTGFRRPGGERSAGHEAIADASDAHDAKMARFSDSVRLEFATIFLGWSNAVPGCSRASKLNTVSSFAVVRRMFSSIF